MNTALDCLKILAGQKQSREFTHKDVITHCGLKSREIVYLTEKGTIIPDIANAHGHHSSRVYSSRNLLEFCIARALRDSGIEHARVKDIVMGLRRYCQKLEGIVDGGEEFLVKVFDGKILMVEVDGQAWGTPCDMVGNSRMSEAYDFDSHWGTVVIHVDRIYRKLERVI